MVPLTAHPGDVYEFVGNEGLVPGEVVRTVTVVSVDPLVVETEHKGQRHHKQVADEEFFFKTYLHLRRDGDMIEPKQPTFHVRWEDDWSVSNHRDEYGEAYDAGEPDTCEVVTVFDDDGNIWASLGCVDNASGEYRKAVEEEVLAEAKAEWLRQHPRQDPKRIARELEEIIKWNC